MPNRGSGDSTSRDERHDELFTNMPTDQALRQFEIHALRQIADNLAAQTRRLETLTEKVDDIRERVIKLESQKTEDEIRDLREQLAGALSKIDALEAMRDQAKGAANLWVWLAKYAPWLFAGLAAFAAGLGWKGKLP